MNWTLEYIVTRHSWLWTPSQLVEISVFFSCQWVSTLLVHLFGFPRIFGCDLPQPVRGHLENEWTLAEMNTFCDCHGSWQSVNTCASDHLVEIVQYWFYCSWTMCSTCACKLSTKTRTLTIYETRCAALFYVDDPRLREHTLRWALRHRPMLSSDLLQLTTEPKPPSCPTSARPLEFHLARKLPSTGEPCAEVTRVTARTCKFMCCGRGQLQAGC
jgi:hypothetical protein